MSSGEKHTETEALQLLARYSLPPNSLGYCGKNSATAKLKECIVNGKCDTVGDEIKHFIVLHPYVKTIALLANKDLFNYDVAECFWLGNNLIEQATLEHYDLLLDNFSAQGVPEGFVAELRQKRPSRFIPFHLFQVLHVGVGKSSGAVPFNLDSINNCMIRWGSVQSVNSKLNEMEIKLNSLEVKGASYHLCQKVEKFQFDPQVVSKVKKGDVVTVHWGIVNKILTKTEKENLEFWTKESLRVVRPD